MSMLWKVWHGLMEKLLKSSMVCISAQKIWSIKHIYVKMSNVIQVQIITPVKGLSKQFAFTSNKPKMLRELREHLQKEKTSGYFYEDTSSTTVNCQAIQMARNLILLIWTKCKLQFLSMSHPSTQPKLCLMTAVTVKMNTFAIRIKMES